MTEYNYFPDEPDYYDEVEWDEKDNPNENTLDWVKPQTPEQVADGLKEAFREAVKQGVVSSTTQQPKQWRFSDHAEEAFTTWFNDIYGTYSHRCEWFFGDCEVEDEKTRKDLLYKWIHAAYCAGYEQGVNK